MPKYYILTGLGAFAAILAFLPRPASSQGNHGQPANHQGQGLILELDNEFIQKYANRATIASEFTIAGISGVHSVAMDGNDGEVHIGGWSHEAGLAGVSEIMNAAHNG